MKKPKPRDYGLDSDHPAGSSLSINYLTIDPNQPITEDECDAALERLIIGQVEHSRRTAYAKAMSDWEWGNGGR